MIIVRQNELVANLRVVGDLISNKVVALDTSHLKILSVDNTQYLAGFGSQHGLVVKIGDNRLEDFSVSVEYSKLMALVSYMQEEITLDATNEGVLTKDSTVETYLNNIMADNTDVVDVKTFLTAAEGLKEGGMVVNRKEFYDALRYLRGIQERDDRTDIETGIMFTKEFSYVVSDLYGVRYGFGLEKDLVLDNHVTRVLLPLLAKSDDEEFIISRREGITYFYVGENVYRVDGLSDEVMDQYVEIFNHRNEKARAPLYTVTKELNKFKQVLEEEQEEFKNLQKKIIEETTETEKEKLAAKIEVSQEKQKSLRKEVEELEQQEQEVSEQIENNIDSDIILMDKKECLRILNLTKVLTDTTEPDINFTVKDGKVRIHTGTQDGDTVDTEFVAENCSNVNFTVSVGDLISVISKLPNNVAEQLILEVINIPEEDKYDEPDLLHFRHELGDSVFSINTDVE